MTDLISPFYETPHPRPTLQPEISLHPSSGANPISLSKTLTLTGRATRLAAYAKIDGSVRAPGSVIVCNVKHLSLVQYPHKRRGVFALEEIKSHGVSTSACYRINLALHLLVEYKLHAAAMCASARCCIQAYAMTEASHQMTSNPLPKNGPHKPGTVGIPQGSVQARDSGIPREPNKRERNPAC